MSAPAPARVPVEELARLAVAVVLHDRGALRAFARTHGAASADRGVAETLLQCHLFCGVPRTIAALDTLREAGFALDASPPEEAPPAERAARGDALFDRIYGDQHGAVRAHLARLEPTFARWVLDHAYGRVLSRPGLDAEERELVAMACLAATGHDRQLASHTRGAVRCGAAPGRCAGVLDAVAPLVDPERLARARDVVARFARPE